MSQPLSPRVIVMNDTSGRSHHGCARVMRLLYEGLARHGLQVIFRSPARQDWAKTPGFLAALDGADLVVINGEGTLHHGREAGRTLLNVIPVAKAKGVPVALINALWQDNPAEWIDLLAGAALIATRDQRSADEIGKSLDAVRVLPDLSLSAGAAAQPGPRDHVYFGDSVRWSTRRALALAATRLRADALLPTKTRSSAFWTRKPTGPWLSALYHGVAPFGLPPLKLAVTEADYLALLGRAQMHVTGRFHGICLSLVTGTPFLTTGSNSWKIEALLADAGLPKSRAIAEADLPALTQADLQRPFTAEETAGIARFLSTAQRESAALFADLAALAWRGRP